MSSYRIKLSKNAERQFDEWIASGNIAVLNKIARLFDELESHPMTGTGKPEMLKGDLRGCWSRRITKSDRLVYHIDEGIVVVDILSIKGHYGDK